MSDYHINLFYSDEDDSYVADIPDLDACSAFGSSPDGAKSSVGSIACVPRTSNAGSPAVLTPRTPSSRRRLRGRRRSPAATGAKARP